MSQGYRQLKQRQERTRFLVTLAMLCALVFVLQFFGGLIPPIGVVNLSFVLIPIVIFALTLGVKGGLVLGLVFGGVVLLGLLRGDFLTLLMFEAHPIITVALCLLKGAAAGVIPALIYKSPLRKKCPRITVFVASASAPIANTGIFLLGTLFFVNEITGVVAQDGGTFASFILVSILLCNFVAEFVLNLVACPAILRVIHAAQSRQLLSK